MDDPEDCIPNYLDINTHKNADDCTQNEVIPYGSTSNMQEVLDAMNDWALRSKMKLNAKKTKDMWICFKSAIPEPPSLTIGDDKPGQCFNLWNAGEKIYAECFLPPKRVSLCLFYYHVLQIQFICVFTWQ